MPSIISKKRRQEPSAVMPIRQARAYAPEIIRDTIPWHPTLDTGQVPWSGEIREEMLGEPILSVTPTLPANKTFTVLAALRRPWNYVGWSVDVSNFAGAVTGLAVTLRILTRLGPGLLANVPPVTLTGDAFIFSGINYIVGAPCELILVNATETAAVVRGLIWGMSDH